MPAPDPAAPGLVVRNRSRVDSDLLDACPRLRVLGYDPYAGEQR